MAAKQKSQGKHIPQRTCIGCRQIQAKRHLIRIVRTPEGVVVDRTGKVNGRGAYLHDDLSCWVKGLKGPLASALRTELTEEDQKRLAEFAATLKPLSLSGTGNTMEKTHPD